MRGQPPHPLLPPTRDIQDLFQEIPGKGTGENTQLDVVRQPSARRLIPADLPRTHHEPAP